MKDPNLLVGMYALRTIEELGEPFSAEIAAAQKSKYEFSRRVAKRLTRKWSCQ